jgi:hypothetical protein
MRLGRSAVGCHAALAATLALGLHAYGSAHHRIMGYRPSIRQLFWYCCLVRLLFRGGLYQVVLLARVVPPKVHDGAVALVV